MRANDATVTAPTNRPPARHAWSLLAAHLVLLAGCVVFSLPFYWLLSTSVKETDEIQRDPPVWVPAWPRGAKQSPFIELRDSDEPKAPEGVDEGRFRAFWPTVETALWEWVQPRLPDDAATLPEARVRRAMAGTLWNDVQAGTPKETWSQPSAEIAAALVAGLDEEDLGKAWDRVYRFLGFRDVVIEDQGFVRHVVRLADGERQADRWAPAAEGAALKPARPDEKPYVAVAYDLGSDNSVSWSVDLPTEVTADQFRGVIIPVRHDHSWNRLWLSVDVGGRRFSAIEPLVLSDRAWLDVTWRLPDRGRTTFEVHDFQELRAQGNGEAAPGTVRLTARLERVGALGAVWGKWSRNYRDALRYVPFWTLVANTVWIVAMCILGQVFACSLVAFSFARLNWPFRDACFGLLLATMMLPGQVTMIPQFLVFKYVGWYNTLKPLWVPAFFGSAFFIFMLRQFMKGIPKDLEDAAKIDGCSYFGIYWRIMLPLIKPALAAIAIFTFMGSWNNFMGPLIYVSDQRLYPLALGLFQFRSEHSADFGMLMAASALMTVPVVGIFFAAQRYFIQGVTLTGMKG